MRRFIVLGALIAGASLVPGDADAINWPLYASGYRCDDLGSCTNMDWTIYQNRTLTGNGDAGTWSLGVDALTGETTINVSATSGNYLLYVDGICGDGEWNVTGFASMCKY